MNRLNDIPWHLSCSLALACAFGGCAVTSGGAGGDSTAKAQTEPSKEMVVNRACLIGKNHDGPQPLGRAIVSGQEWSKPDTDTALLSKAHNVYVITQRFDRDKATAQNPSISVPVYRMPTCNATEPSGGWQALCDDFGKNAKWVAYSDIPYALPGAPECSGRDNVPGACRYHWLEDTSLVRAAGDISILKEDDSALGASINEDNLLDAVAVSLNDPLHKGFGDFAGVDYGDYASRATTWHQDTDEGKLRFRASVYVDESRLNLKLTRALEQLVKKDKPLALDIASGDLGLIHLQHYFNGIKSGQLPTQVKLVCHPQVQAVISGKQTCNALAGEC